nr:hypothetical protein CFP56_56916 [Quercus suber]POE80849.1 hypothetical protein CFP56_56922 [Quercus suber]
MVARLSSHACELVTAAAVACGADLIIKILHLNQIAVDQAVGLCLNPAGAKVEMVEGRVAPVNCLLGQLGTVAALTTKHLSLPPVRLSFFPSSALTVHV